MKKIIKTKLFSIIICLMIAIILALFFSYKILDIPTGLTSDEIAFGHNAVLLSRTLHDENNRFLPIFVLSNNGTDWKQPVTQYYLTILFKIFTPSVFLLRFSSVIVIILCIFLLYKFSKTEYSNKLSFFAAILFLTTPLILIQSHMALDNIMPIPFTIIWLFCLFLYNKKSKTKFLIISAISLGITFYTYKGMRAIFPIWYILSLFYLINPKKWFKSIFIFSLFSLPFILISPLLDHYYGGAILGGANLKIDSIYNFIYPYLSSFDPTFLFIKGDETLYHSTGIHGFFLISTLPLFLLGIYYSISKNKNSRFLLATFFLAPLLYGTVGSVHRASRLMCLIPIYVLICTNGVEYIKLKKLKLFKLIIICYSFLITINYIDFVNYYHSTYPGLTQNIFGDLKMYRSFEYLKEESQRLNLIPYVSQNISNPFFESIYFPNGLTKINQSITPPKGSILLTERENIDAMQNIKTPLLFYKIQTN